jgi:hypothetical protein
MLDRIQDRDIGIKYKVVLVYAVRDDEDSFIFKHFLTNFFSTHEMYMYELCVAVSRNLTNPDADYLTHQGYI